MGVSIVGTETAYASDTTVVSLAPHASTNIGDFVCAVFADLVSGGSTQTPGTSFSVQASVQNIGTTMTVGLFGKLIESAADLVSYDFALAAGTSNLSLSMVTLRNASGSTPVGAVGTWQGSATTATAIAPSLTCSFSACVLLSVFCAKAVDENWSTPVGMTELADFPYATYTSRKIVAQVGIDALAVNAGATGAQTAVLSGTPEARPVALSIILNARRALGTPLFGINT